MPDAVGVSPVGSLAYGVPPSVTIPLVAPLSDAFVHKLKLKSAAEWIAFRRGKLPRLGRLPADIPANPEKSYADAGWKGMGDWLGTGTLANHLRVFRPFPQARAFARRLKLKNLKDWRAFCEGKMPHLGQRPADIPAKPSRTYANKGWDGLADWLGKSRKAVTRWRKK